MPSWIDLMLPSCRLPGAFRFSWTSPTEKPTITAPGILKDTNVCSLFAAPENAEPPSRPDGLTE